MNEGKKRIRTVLLNIIPIVVGVLLVFRNLVASDMFNIGLSLILISINNIINSP